MTSRLRFPRVDGLRRVRPAPKTSTRYMLRAFVDLITSTASSRKHRPSSVQRWRHPRSSRRLRPGQM
jgi:hypothetical protein